MTLTTGQIKLVYPTGWSVTTNLTAQIGGTPQTGNFVNTSTTGLFPTGTSSVAGGATSYRYAKVFFLHTGSTGATNNLQDPFVYITNETVYNQVTMSPDPYFLALHGAQTGLAVNRTTMPDQLSASYFTGYTADNPLRLSSLNIGSYTLTSGNAIGLWVRQAIVAGLTTSANNTFQFVLQGDIA